jgi:hypothetical protein
MCPTGPRQNLTIPSLAAWKARLSWMLGTASVLVASRAWAGGEDGLGIVFGLFAGVGVLAAIGFGAGLVMLFFNLMGRKRSYSVFMGILLGVMKMKIGVDLIIDFVRGDSVSESASAGTWKALAAGLLILGAFEIFAAVRAMRAAAVQ